ncbi:MAG: efflux RND transporter permease subunit [Alphaproteobacteria bacterium]|nr:efflux RND transporter permease subunit [Alphaproteobacteria bacterium]
MSDPTADEPPATGVIAWMARNSVAANLLMVVVIVGGLLQSCTTKQEIFPEFTLDIVSVSVPYPGASPAEVEQGIVLAVEEAVRGVDGVKKVTSTSAENVGSVLVELLLGADPNKALADVKNEVDRIQTFPDDAEDPQVSLVSRKSRVIGMILSGDQQLSTLFQLAERARADLLARGGVTQLEIEGVPPLEIRVGIDRDTLRAYGLTLDEVALQLRAASLELPSGGIDTERGEILVRVADRARTGADFRDIILRGTRAGAQVRLGDIATVVDGFADTDQRTTFNGRPAVALTAYRVGTETPSGVSDVVKAYTEELRSTLPGDIEVTIWDDDSELLRDRIDLLVRNGIMGGVLVFVVLALFLDLRLASWVALGIPISFCGAFFLFPIFDVSINMISLFALIVTLGIVVDDAIVVGENVHEKTEAGLPPLQAAIEGAREMVVPVTFAVLTTFAAFAPLLFVPGTSGKIFRFIPIVVMSVLAFSLLESFLVLPSHLGHTTRMPRWTHRVLYVIDAPRRFMTGHLERFIQGPYDRLLDVALDFRYATLGAAIALFFGAVGVVATGILPFSFLPKTEGDIIKVQVRLPYGAPIERTIEIADVLEASFDEALAEVGDPAKVKGRLTLVGSGPASFGPGASGGRPAGSHLLSLEVDLVGSDERDFSTAELADAWQAKTPRLAGVESLTFTKDVGPSGGAAVDVQLAHTDTSVLADASAEVTEALRDYPSLINISNGYAAGKPQLDLRPLPEARTLGLTGQEIGRQLRASFYGTEAIREQRGRNELKVMVRLTDAQRTSEYDLEELDVRTPRGAWVPVASVAEVVRSQAPTQITRESGRRVVDVVAELAPGTKSSRPVLEDLEATVLPALRERHPGLTTRFAGEQESQNESLSSLGRNFLFALFVMFALLAIPFKSYVQPVIIMAAIPFGFVGAVGGHLLMGFELSIISAMGIIALSGVVVNDSLVLIDAANTYRRGEPDSREAIHMAGKRRFRPILLTSLTTFFGLMPMIFEPSVQARFLIPMAISLGFGVLFGTVIALVIVPGLYLIVEDALRVVRWLTSPDEPVADAPPEAHLG